MKIVNKIIDMKDSPNLIPNSPPKLQTNDMNVVFGNYFFTAFCNIL